MITNSFIPAFHYTNDKLNEKWCKAAVDYCYHNSNNIGLLADKDLHEIETFADGQYDLSMFIKMFKSVSKAVKDIQKKNPNYTYGKNDSPTDLMFMCVPLIPPKLNAIEAIVQKQPTEIEVKALDPLAAKKKQEDLRFLTNKQKIEEQLQALGEKLGIEKVDLGTTKYSSVPFGSDPYGLNLLEPDEAQVFADLIYELDVEKAFETILMIFDNIKKIQQFRLLETKDQLRYGVSVNRAFQSSITGLPDIEYIYPQMVKTFKSKLPDYSDVPHMLLDCVRLTPLELINIFGDDIPNEKELERIVNGESTGYCSCNEVGTKTNTGCFNVPRGNWDNFKMDLLYFEVKSVDFLSVGQKEVNGRTMKYVTDSTDDESATGKIWMQNTYTFWWLKNTEHFFAIDKLDFSHRKKGQESFQSYSINIHKSQNKSAVELSIPENKKAQVAYIKMMYAIIKALPNGRLIDLKGLNNILTRIDDYDGIFTKEQLINMAIEENTILIDTSGFDSKLDGQMKPFIPIPGGLNFAEISGYMQTILDANSRINQYMGTNDTLTGQNANAEDLVGVQKIKLNQSLNSQNYVAVANQSQYTKVYTNWAAIIKIGIEEGGALKEAIVNFIGAEKVSIIDGLSDLPLHTMGISISTQSTAEEEQKYRQDVYDLKAQGILQLSDEYALSAIQNKKDKFKYLAVKEKQHRRRLDKEQQQKIAAQQQMIQQQGQNMVAAKSAEAEGERNNIYAKADANSRIIQLQEQLGLHKQQFQAVLQKSLNQDRIKGQIEKLITGINAKSSAKNQEALA